MINKRMMRGWLFFAIPFLIFGIFACGNLNRPKKNTGDDTIDDPVDPPVVKEGVIVRFEVSPSDQGSIKAVTADGSAFENGTKVKKGEKLTFTLTINNPDVYEIYRWDGANSSTNLLEAHLTVTEAITVTAMLKNKNDKVPSLEFLKIYNKKVDVYNLEDVNVEVENFVETLNARDILAMFLWDSTPSELMVRVDKETLDVGENIVTLTLDPKPGEYIDWTGKVKITRKGAEQAKTIEPDVMLESIEVALLSEKNKKPNIEEYKPIADFKGESSGYYKVEQAKTAYIRLKMKKTKPADGDVSIEVVNKNTYINPIRFNRKSDGDTNYFLEQQIALSKGYNVLEVKVTNADNTKEGVYILVIKYDGGPNPLEIASLSGRKMVSATYCPLPRKPLEGEEPDLIWMMSIAGYCHYCEDALQVAGNVGNVANKYKSKGLRVIVFDVEGSQYYGSEAKWRGAGAGFPLYDRNTFSFKSFHSDLPGYPYNVAIKDGQIIERRFSATEDNIKKIFGF